MNFSRLVLPALIVLSSSLLATDARALSNSEIFSQIHTKETIHIEMQPGFYEFRIYKEKPDSASFLLEYRSETGKCAVFECDYAFILIKLTGRAKPVKNHLALKYKGRLYMYQGSTNAYYLEGVNAKP